MYEHRVLCNVDHTVIYDAIPFIIINYILLSAARAAVDGLKKIIKIKYESHVVFIKMSITRCHDIRIPTVENIYSYPFTPPSSHARPTDHSRFLSINIIIMLPVL